MPASNFLMLTDSRAPYPTLPGYDYKDLDQARAAKFAAVAAEGEEKQVLHSVDVEVHVVNNFKVLS